MAENRISDNRRILYDAMVQDNYELTDFDDFSKKLDDENIRKALHKQLVDDNFDVGDYESFNKNIYSPQGYTLDEMKATPMTERYSAAPEPSSSLGTEAQQIADTPATPKPSFGLESGIPTIAETTRKKMAQDVEKRQQRDNLASQTSEFAEQIKGELNRRGAELDSQESAEPEFLVEASSNTPSFLTKRMSDPEYRDYSAAQEYLDNARKIINEVNANSNDENAIKKFIKGVGRGLKENILDLNNVSFGAKDTSEELALLQALDASDKGTATPSQEALLDAKAIEMAVQEYYGSDVSRGYKAGQSTAESIPFMVEMALNPLASAGKGISSRLAKYALKKYVGKKTAGKVGKYVATRALPRAVQATGDLLGASGMAATTGAAHTAANALSRMQGDVKYMPSNEEGKVQYWSHTEGEDAPTAFAKAYADTVIQNYSEMLGNYFAPITGKVGRGVSNLLEKVHLGGVNTFLHDVSASDLSQLVSDFGHYSNWNGAIGEYGEEMLGGILNAIVVGDQTLDTAEGTGVFNKDNLIDTALAVGLMSGSMNAAQTIGYPIYKYKAKRDVQKAKIPFNDLFSEAERKNLDKAFNDNDARVAGEALREIVNNDGYSLLQKGAAMEYATTIQKYKGAELFSHMKLSDGSMNPEEVQIEQSYEQGRTLETPQEMNDAANMLEIQAQEVRRLYGLDQDVDIDAFLGENPFQKALDIRKTDEDASQIILDYLNAKATTDGVVDNAKDKIERLTMEADALIASRTSNTDGLIHPAVMKLNDRKVYVVSGNVSVLDDGAINTQESDDIIIMDATTGKREFASAKDLLSIDEAIDPEAEKQNVRNTIADTIATEVENKMNNVLPFNVGDAYNIIGADGAEHSVQVMADNGDGSVMASIDNAEAVAMPKSEIQQMSNDYNMNRVKLANEAQKEAKQSEKMMQESQNVEPTQEDVAEVAQPQIPTNEQGEPMYEQAPVADTWAELVALNEGNEEEAIDTANIMLQNAKKALDKANKTPKAKGSTVAEIQAAKAERKALIDEAQAQVDYWSNVVGYRDSQPQQVVTETAPVVEEAKSVIEEQTPVIEETAPIVEEQTPVEAEVKPIEEEQGEQPKSNENENVQAVEQDIDDIPATEVSGRAEEVKEKTISAPAQEADISDEDIAALWIKSRDELWKPNDELGQMLHEKLYEAHPEAHQPEERKKVVRHLIEAVEKHKDHPIAKEVLKYVKYPTTTSMRSTPTISNKEENRRKPLRERANEWEKKVGVKIELIESIDEVDNADAREAIERGKHVTGWTVGGKVYLYMPHISSRTEVDKTYLHEVVAHVGMKELLGKDGYKAFCKRVWDEVMTDAEREFYRNYPNVENEEQAADEFIAHISEDVELNASAWQKIVRFFKDALRAMGVDIHLTNADIQDLLRESYLNLAEQNGAVDINEQEGQAMFSIRTYKEGGKAQLDKFLNDQVKKKRITKEEAKEIADTLDEMYKTAVKYKNKYAPFGAWSEAKVVENKDGMPAFSVIKKNGDYSMNLDFSTVCKKRRTLDAVFSEMIQRGLISNLDLDGEQIAEINNIIRRYGFETACALCFVDAKRFRVAQVADKFCEMWNPMAVMTNRQLRAIIKAEGDTVRRKVAKYLLDNPDNRIQLKRENFIDSHGFEEMEINNPEILSLYKQAQGTSLAKIPFGDVQYLNDLEKRHQWTPDKAYAVGGVRLQSFSDYVPRMFFDYMQLMADLSAKNLPVHAYTKEPIFAKQFGLTGMKINLSLVPKVVDGGVAAGLDADGNYAWMEGETFPYEEAIALQNAEGYRENCGTIAVGVSDAHIEKLLDDPNIRMVIPYHKSGLNPLVAKKNRINEFVDYTNVQNTRSAEGTKLESEDLADMPNFNALMYYEDVDARQAAQAYLDWCDGKGYLPKFDKWRNHPNYYKLLEDFTTIVPDANGVESIYPQGAVSMTFPTEDSAFGSIESLIREGLEEDAVLEGRRDANVGKIVDTIEEELVQFRFIGEKGAANIDKAEEATIRLDNLAIARLMEYEGNTDKSIKMATGWERGADGKWRYEVNDDITAKHIRSMKGAGLKKIQEARSKRMSDLDKFMYIVRIVGADRLYDDKKILATSWSDAQKQKWLDAYEMYKDDREGAIEDIRKANAEYKKLRNLGKGEFILYEVLGNDHSLFKEYPQLRNVNVVLKPYKGGGDRGNYNRLTNTITIIDFRGIMENDKGEGSANTLVHEIQHIIQSIEGFARGGNTIMDDPRKIKAKEAEVAHQNEMFEDAVKERNALSGQMRLLNQEMMSWWDNNPDATWEDALADEKMFNLNKQYSDIEKQMEDVRKRVELHESALESAEGIDTSLGLEGYKRLAGEVEARNVERRRNMSLGERRNSPAWETEDVSRKDQIFIYDALGKNNTQFRITPEEDARYLQLVEEGNLEEAQKMVNAVANASGYNNDESWKKAHTAPRKSKDNVNPFNTEELVPADYWTHPEWYTNIRNSADDRESYYNMVSAINKYKRLVAEGKQDEANKVTVKMYRGVDKTANAKESTFRNGDWITPSRSYAKWSAPEGRSRVIEQEVPLKNIWWDGNSINEWGYDDGANYVYKDTKNNRKLVDAVTYDDNGNVIPLSKRFNSRNADIRFRIPDYDSEFADLQREYDALDKNDIEALNEWREKKTNVVSGYLAHIKNIYGMTSELIVFNGADEDKMKEAYQRLVDTYSANGNGNPPTYDAFRKHSLKPEVVATYRRGGNAISFNATADDARGKEQFAETLFHENAHRISYGLFNDDRFKAVWDSVSGKWNNIVRHVARKYKDGSDVQKGKEIIAKAVGYLSREHKKHFLQFTKGNISAEALVRKLHIRSEIANLAIVETLNTLKDEYTIQLSRRGKARRMGGVGYGSEQRDTRMASQGDARVEQGRGRGGVRGQRGGFVLEPLAKDVAQRGLREIVGEKVYSDFLMRALRDADEVDRRAIVNTAMRNGLNFLESTESHLASLAEQENINEAYLGRVKNLFTQMLADAGIDTEGISNNELRYLLWRNALKDNGAMSVAEDVVMQQKLGVGNYRTRPAGTSDKTMFRTTPNPADIEDGEVKQIRKKYDKKVNTGRKGTLRMTKYNFIEANQDEMRSLKEYQKLVKEAYGIDKLPSHLDVYALENRIGSAGFEKFNRFVDSEYEVMQQFIDDYIAMGGETLESVIDYARAKSGLERNREFTVRDYIDKEAKAKLITKKEAEEMLEQVNIELQNDIITPTQADARRQQINNMLNTNKNTEEQITAMREQYKAQRDAYRKMLEDGLISYADFNRMSDEYVKKFTGLDVADYSGLSATAERMGKKANEWKKVAADTVEAFENKHDNTKEFWSSVKACNDAVIKEVYDSGMISKQLYDHLKEQLLWYIPMSGFTEDTAEDVYSYIGGETGAFTPPVKKAVGRLSESDDPFAIIANKMQGAILQGNRNRIKLAFLNLVQTYPTDLVTEGKVWLTKQADGTWEMNMLEIPADTSSDDVAQLIEEYNQKMRSLKKQGLAREYKNKLNVPYVIQTRSHQNDHEIIAYRNGQQYVMYVNGNPQLAKAINGKLKDKGINFFYKLLDKWNRIESANKTSWNPDFIAPNVMRDFEDAILSTFIDAGVKDAAKLAKTFVAVFPEVVRSISGSENKSGKYAKYFEEFIQNGGETGYSHLHDVEKWKDINQRRWKRLGLGGKALNTPVQAFNGIGSMFSYLNRIAEDSTRFAAYVHSRQKGKTIGESIKAAKDITTNFNKKGSGATEGIWGFLANFMRRWFLFYNPMVQGIYKHWERMTQSKKRYALVFAAMAGAGYLAAVLNKAATDDDDEEKKYFNQSDYTRRTNIMIYTGDGYIKIPLAPVFREMYALGDIMYSIQCGVITPWEGTKEVVNLVRGLFNLEGQSSLKDKEFSWFRFVIPQSTEFMADIEDNVTFTGTPLYKDTPWNKFDPEYQKVYNGTWTPLIRLSKAINDILPHEDYLHEVDDQMAGKGSSKWINPAVWQHIIEDVTGGIGKTIGDAITIVDNIKNDTETDLYNIPIAKRFYAKPDERTRGRILKNQYYDAIEELDRMNNKYKKYTDYLKANLDPIEIAAKTLEYWDSDEGKLHKLIKDSKSKIDKLNRQLKEAKDDASAEEITLQQEQEMNNLIESLKAMESSNK